MITTYSNGQQDILRQLSDEQVVQLTKERLADPTVERFEVFRERNPPGDAARRKAKTTAGKARRRAKRSR